MLSRRSIAVLVVLAFAVVIAGIAAAPAAEKTLSIRSMLSQWELTEPFYRWVKESHPKIKRVAVISPNDTSGKDTNTAVVKALKTLGFEAAADEYYERGTKDFYPVLTKVLAQ